MPVSNLLFNNRVAHKNSAKFEMKQIIASMTSTIPQVRVNHYAFEEFKVAKMSGIDGLDNNTATNRDFNGRATDVSMGRMNFAGTIEVESDYDMWSAIAAGCEIRVRLADYSYKYYVFSVGDNNQDITATSITATTDSESITYTGNKIMTTGAFTCSRTAATVTVTCTGAHGWTTGFSPVVTIYGCTNNYLNGQYTATWVSDTSFTYTTSTSGSVASDSGYWKQEGAAWHPGYLQNDCVFLPSDLPHFDIKVTRNANTLNQDIIYLSDVVFTNLKENTDKAIATFSLDFIAARVYRDFRSATFRI